MFRLGLFIFTLMVAGCAMAPPPLATRKVAETRWLLIRNPAFGARPGESQYVWVEADKVPTTITTLVHGRAAIIAPPEIVASYGLPPSEASPRQTATIQESPIRRCRFHRHVRIPIIDPRTGEIVAELEGDLKAAPEPCWPDY